jgi:CRP-like cAMP-binding protein
MNGQGQPEIKALIENLHERSKELECMYCVDEILKDIDKDLNSVFAGLMEIIPSGWRYPDICRVQILFDGQEYRKENFKKSELKQSASITIENKILGEIQVFYIKPVRSEKGIFLSEEFRMLGIIAQKLSNFILYKRLRESMLKPEPESLPAAADEPFHQWLANLGLLPEQIAILTKIRVNFRKGETICKQGALVTYVILLAEGLTKSCLEASQERSFDFKINKAFDFIGLTALFGNGVYHFSCSALTGCTAYMVERDKFLQIIEQNREFSTSLMKWYCNSFGILYGKISSLANKQALGRIAEVLLYLSESVFDNGIITNILSRKDIAEMAGMSNENAVRILSELKNDNIIKISTQGIEIANFKLLRTLSIAG